MLTSTITSSLCANCLTPFTHGGARVTCSNLCATAFNSRNSKKRKELKEIAERDYGKTQSLYVPTSFTITDTKIIREEDLPPPEQLPAPYAKRVYDMWASLIGEKESTPRIA